jgi:type II secretory pathway predicted ATPase ExeA
MYYRHFNLSGPPFEAASNPESPYLSRAHRESLAALEWGLLYEPSGFTSLTGETGTGKTTLVCSILARNFAQLCAAYVVNPKLSFEDILRVVLGQFGIPCESASKLDRIEALVGHLGRQMPHERLAVIVDEAQDLSDDALEELRLLSNYGQRVGRYLQLVLVGQPELSERLKSPKLRQFNQRVAARSVLGRLSFNEAHEYVAYRLRARGGRSKDIFDPNALAYLLRHSSGIPRQINVLCHNAMLVAYSSGAAQVTLKEARTAVAEYGESLLGWSAPLNNPFTAPRATMVATGTLALLVAVAYGYRSPMSRQPEIAGYSLIKHEVKSNPPAAWSGKTAVTTDVALKAGSPMGRILARKRERNSLLPSTHVIPPTSDPRPENPQLENPQTEDNALILPPSSSAPGSLLLLRDNEGEAIHMSRMLPDPQQADARPSVSVKYGDTLEKMAQTYLGSRYALNVLIAANPQISNINMIFPGQKVYLSVPPNAEPGVDTATPEIPSRHAAIAEEEPAHKKRGSYVAGNEDR